MGLHDLAKQLGKPEAARCRGVPFAWYRGASLRSSCDADMMFFEHTTPGLHRRLSTHLQHERLGDGTEAKPRRSRRQFYLRVN